MKHRHFIFLLSNILMVTIAFSQEVYFGQVQEMIKYNVQTCEGTVEYDFSKDENIDVTGVRGLSFHPDGRMYIISGSNIVQYHPVKKHHRIFELSGPNDVNSIAISEEGRCILGGPSGPSTIYDYNLRENRINQVIDDNSLPDGARKSVEGILKDNKFIVHSISGENAIGIWDPDSLHFFSIFYSSESPQAIINGTIYYPSCETWNFIGSTFVTGFLNPQVVLVDTVNRESKRLCSESIFSGGATPTDFRQSSLRIDLDGDNSSGHIAAGYYDTLTTCMKEAPVLDDDVELYTCGAEVDYISFRLMYYDQPELPRNHPRTPAGGIRRRS